mmetsp:Transcript_49133/g.104900  ORF Transcript_49133/g.104900 Transcript_49133/m.104900 type:complete len:97 (-) Transcript_49133:789-1079(-)
MPEKPDDGAKGLPPGSSHGRDGASSEAPRIAAALMAGADEELAVLSLGAHERRQRLLALVSSEEAHGADPFGFCWLSMRADCAAEGENAWLDCVSS